MGTKFFQQKPPSIGPSNLNMESRALNAGTFAGRAAGGAANKDLGAAIALYKAHALKPMQRGAAYPPGPKKV
jgi:hypothetical protein